MPVRSLPCATCSKHAKDVFFPRHFAAMGHEPATDLPTLPPKPKRAAPAAERFWQLVDRSNPEGCWPWIGSRSANGYGNLRVGMSMVYAHRRALELATGKAPPGKIAMHSCDNPPCCNPAHLRWGTVKENSQDMLAKGRGRPGGRTAVPA